MPPAAPTRHDHPVPTPTPLLRWQFDLTWSLLEYHLVRLDPGAVRWEPGPLVWTVRPGADGIWRPDWADTEPDPVPVPTIAWLAWHVAWWWGTAADHLAGVPPRSREDVAWPGDDGVAAQLRSLRAAWLPLLDGLTDDDLARPAPFPWPAGSDETVAHMVAWVNAELMKNAAEIGHLRLQHAAL